MLFQITVKVKIPKAKAAEVFLKQANFFRIKMDSPDTKQGGRTELCVGDFKIDLMRRQVFLKEEKIELPCRSHNLEKRK